MSIAPEMGHLGLINTDNQYAWNAISAIGVALSAFLAFQALHQSNARLKGEQKPMIVVNNMDYDGQAVNYKNIGRGVALRLFVTFDRDRKFPAQTLEQPHFEYAEPARDQNWRVYQIWPNKLLEYLNQKPDNDKHVDFLPKYKHELHLFFWYEDVSGSKYLTAATFKKTGAAIKNLNNDVCEL